MSVISFWFTTKIINISCAVTNFDLCLTCRYSLQVFIWWYYWFNRASWEVHWASVLSPHPHCPCHYQLISDLAHPTLWFMAGQGFAEIPHQWTSCCKLKLIIMPHKVNCILHTSIRTRSYNFVCIKINADCCGECQNYILIKETSMKLIQN